MAGTLFVVATPIGNLEDLTFRALRTLKEVDIIAAEDTRRTSRLLAHYGVSKPLVSLHEHNEHREAPRLVGRMTEGESIALVSDAGTPAISDPGTRLVRLARESGIRVVPVPGPSAITAALSTSGLPATPFTFLGFPPSSGQARERWLESLEACSGAVVFFEAPHRIARTIKEVAHYIKRPILIYREITKINEELVIWENEFESEIQERGEFVVVLGPANANAASDIEPRDVLSLFDQFASLPSLDEDRAYVAIGALTGLTRQRLARILKKERISVKRQTE
jgi:16S rRNA (cytidine1402-2'-O)-methyltransferase